MIKLKSIFAVAVLLFVTTFVTAQTKVEWKEKNDFHKVMSQTFHPVEEGNYKPIRERSSEMVEKAIAWKNATIPADFKNVKGIKKNLKKLVKESKKLDKKIKNNVTDEEIKDDLTALHDIFHNIVGLCKATEH